MEALPLGGATFSTAMSPIDGSSKRTEQGDYEIHSVPSMLGEHSM
jgi:hypothetical protein